MAVQAISKYLIVFFIHNFSFAVIVKAFEM